MASSNSLEPWSFRPTFSDSWFSDAFTRDTETLTRALQRSLTTTNNNYYTQTETETGTETGTTTTTLIDNTTNNNNNSSLFQYLVKSEQMQILTPTPTSSVSDPDTNILMPNNNNMVALVPKRRNAVIGKISKRKSRASKRSPTTFIAADPCNFRQMVQQVTGIQFCGHQSVTSVLKPEPHRPGTRIQHQHNNFNLGLPTLDTSAFLLDNNSNSNSNAPVVVDDGIGGGAPPAAAATSSSGGLDFQNFQSFPTLESWRAIM